MSDFLVKPVLMESTDTERKGRNYLLFSSCVTIAMYFYGLSFSTNMSAFGFQLYGFNEDKIYLLLSILLPYFLLHYIWLIFDSLLNWRLRLSALSGFKPESWSTAPDYPQPDDNRNNTLYYWWFYHKDYFEQRCYSCDDIVQLLQKLKGFSDSGKSDLESSDALSEAIRLCENSRNDLKAFLALLNSSPISSSLSAFNSSFRFFLLSQNIRWIIFECVIPFSLSLCALCILVMRFYS